MQLIKSTGYNIYFENQAFVALNDYLKKHSYSSVFIICDENTLQHCLPILITKCPPLASAEIIEVESGELTKNIEICCLIWQTLLENNADRKSLLLNLGGGVVSDLGGFAASVYKRGISFINVPTSLLAMADASVGGKTGIDFSGVKNTIGTFKQPDAVFINPEFLNTLSERHRKNGLTEIFKIALVQDRSFWNKIESMPVETQILNSVRLKNKIVGKDPFDKGVRQVLNFGHTIGHAIEGALISKNVDILHGEAIVAGMLIESHLAYQKKLLSKTDFETVVFKLTSNFELPGIHTSLQEINSFLLNDKKAIKNKVQFALINGIGSCKLNVSVTQLQMDKAYQFYQKLTND